MVSPGSGRWYLGRDAEIRLRPRLRVPVAEGRRQKPAGDLSWQSRDRWTEVGPPPQASPDTGVWKEMVGECGTGLGHTELSAS